MSIFTTALYVKAAMKELRRGSGSGRSGKKYCFDPQGPTELYPGAKPTEFTVLQNFRSRYLVPPLFVMRMLHNYPEVCAIYNKVILCLNEKVEKEFSEVETKIIAESKRPAEYILAFKEILKKVEEMGFKLSYSELISAVIDVNEKHEFGYDAASVPGKFNDVALTKKMVLSGENPYAFPEFDELYTACEKKIEEATQLIEEISKHKFRLKHSAKERDRLAQAHEVIKQTQQEMEGLREKNDKAVFYDSLTDEQKDTLVQYFDALEAARKNQQIAHPSLEKRHDVLKSIIWAGYDYKHKFKAFEKKIFYEACEETLTDEEKATLEQFKDELRTILLSPESILKTSPEIGDRLYPGYCILYGCDRYPEHYPVEQKQVTNFVFQAIADEVFDEKRLEEKREEMKKAEKHDDGEQEN